jgi:nitroreductase
VPSEVLERLLVHAAFSPSGTNLQPWQVHVLTGNKKAALESSVLEKYPNAVHGEGFDFRVYPEHMTGAFRQRRSDCGERLYETLEIAREDRNGRINQALKNGTFFGAPVGLIITVDPAIAEMQLVDCGIFLQSLMLLAEAEGLASCAQSFWSMWPETIRSELNIENESIVCGLALGYQDPDARVNEVRQPRIALDEFVTFHQ